MTDRPDLRCACGHDRTHPDIAAEPRYGFFAWILLMLGATGTPTSIRYRCRRCRKLIEETRDPAVLRAFR